MVSDISVYHHLALVLWLAVVHFGVAGKAMYLMAGRGLAGEKEKETEKERKEKGRKKREIG